MFDIVIVPHNQTNYETAVRLMEHDIPDNATHPYKVWIRDNRNDNVGFSKACNDGARRGNYPIIGFINPDAWVVGDFMNPVINLFDQYPDVMITGGNFNKNPAEIHGWGLNDWVCGAAMFVRRWWWQDEQGFDERFVWSHEETDFIRRTEARGMKCKSLGPEELPILHSSPASESYEDRQYKQYHFQEAAHRYHEKYRA